MRRVFLRESKLSNDHEGQTSAPQTPAAALLFQAPEFPTTPPPSSADGQQGKKKDSGSDQDQRPGQKQDQSDDRGSGKQRGSRTSSSKGSQAKSGSGKNAGGKGSASSKQKQKPQEDSAEETKSADSGQSASSKSEGANAEDAKNDDKSGEEAPSSSRRRRRRTRPEPSESGDSSDDQVQAIKGSTRLEAKRMRRRDGRKESRRRQSITEAEFLARRESVDRQMIVRHEDGSDQVAVLEDGVLVEHFVARRTNQSIVGNIYLGKVQNVLPSMEAAFVDIGQGRNAVLYAGEVNWDALGMQGKPRRIETALASGDNVMVQVTKDPIGHKGARLTSQITLAGRYLVLVPGSTVLGISRKLPENERNRLKKALKEIVPEGTGVIVRTAAEGATSEQLTDDVNRLTSQWEKIEKKAASTRKAPVLLRGEPEMVVRVVRDLFNEDVSRLTVQGDETWTTVHDYVEELSPELLDRLEKWNSKHDVFDERNVRSQLAKGMDRKVWLPSGGTLIIERTEALTVVDVNTGKFVGSGGTLEETVTRNNLEAAEEIVRQLRLRDIGGIIIIDFVDMVLEANRELVMRRLVESLGRDRTRHQVTEITSLGLVQMTRKRVGEGLVEAFSTSCEICDGRGFIVHDHPVEIGEGGSKKHRGHKHSGHSGGGHSGSGHSDQKRGDHGRQRHNGHGDDRAPSTPDTHVGDEKVKSALSAIAAATVGAGAEPAKASPETASTEKGSPEKVSSEKADAKETPKKPRERRVARAPQGVPPTAPTPVSDQVVQPTSDTATSGPASVSDIVLPEQKSPADKEKAEKSKRPARRRAVVTGRLDPAKARRSPAEEEEDAQSAREAVRDLLQQ